MMNFVFHCLWILLIASGAVNGWAADDGFGEATQIDGEHFIIDYKSGVDLKALAGQLTVSKSDQMLANVHIDDSSAEKKIASTVEVLFNRASDVLDMRVYSLKAHIKVFLTHQELADFYEKLYHHPLPCTGYSFYLADFDSIYLSAEHMQRSVLGHEMGHAIMTHYFVVQPSIKIQEVLAGYVEYQLRKSE